MLRRVSLHPAPSFRPLGGLSAGARDGAAQLGSLPLRSTAPVRGISSHRTPSASVWSLLGKRSSPLLRQPARRLATESSDAQKQPKDEEQKQKEQEQQQQQKEEDEKKEERKEEKQEDQHKEKEEWEKEREKRGGYKQDVNTFQKVLAVVVPLTALAIGVKTLLDLRGQGAEDDTLQVDMNAVMSHVFQTTVYNVLDSKKLITALGDPLLVEPTKAKFSFTKDFAWISYPLYGPHGHICTVTVDVLRVDPTKEGVKLKKPHMWYVAQVEVDMSNGKKVRMSTRMEGVKQPFNVIHLYHKILEDLKKQEADYLRQKAADEAAASVNS